MGIENFEGLEVWKNGVNIADFVLVIVERNNQKYLFALGNQMQRSSISIASNIAEGNSRQYTKEYIQYCYISLGSCSELLTQVIISKRRNYITQEEFDKLRQMLDLERKMLVGLIKSLKRK